MTKHHILTFALAFVFIAGCGDSQKLGGKVKGQAKKVPKTSRILKINETCTSSGHPLNFLLEVLAWSMVLLNERISWWMGYGLILKNVAEWCQSSPKTKRRAPF